MSKEKYIGLAILGVVILVAIIITIRPPHKPPSITTPTLAVIPTQEAAATSTTPATPQATQSTPSPTQAVIIHDFYTSPDGSPSGDGSRAHPWDLQTALSQPDALKPGDTLWLLGGTYTGEFTSHLKGAADQPITVRGCTDQPVKLVSSDPSQTAVLMVDGSDWVDFWNFEITTNPSADKISGRDGRSSGEAVGFHSKNQSEHIRFINLIVHDMPGLGFGFWSTAVDSAIYGSLIYYNGINQFDHGIYTQNSDGVKVIADNFIFDNASHGIHAYGEGDTKLDNFVLSGNTVFDNGSIGYNSKTKAYGKMYRNILIGGSMVALNPQVTDNYTYFPGREGTSFEIGYKAGSQDAVVENNVFVGGTITMSGDQANLMANNNLAVTDGGPLQFLASLFTPNRSSWLTAKPQQPQIFLRHNEFDPSRSNVTVYNWTSAPTVMLTPDDLKILNLKPGDDYELHNVQDYFNDVQKGVYDGKGISISMEGRTVAQPLSLDFKPPSTFPKFGAFVLIVNPQPICGR